MNPYSGNPYSALRGPTGMGAGQKMGGYKINKLPQFTPDQMQLFSQLFSHVSPDSYTSRLAQGDEGLFDEMERPALRQFNELQGNIASRFSGYGGKGSLGARHSSGFQNSMTAASSNFAQDLQSRRQEMQRNSNRDLLSMSGELLGQRPYETFLQPKKQSFLQQLLGGASGGVGQGIGSIGSSYALKLLGLG